MSNVERFVPVGIYSLSSDAPGWRSSSKNITNDDSKSPNSAYNQNNLKNNNPTIGSDNDDKDHLLKNNDNVTAGGPTCWKCKGKGITMRKDKRQKDENRKKKIKIESTKDDIKKDNGTAETIPCTVCNGDGFLMPKERETQSLNQPGMITATRKCPDGWVPIGPEAYSITQMKIHLDNENYEKLTMIERQYKLLQKSFQCKNKMGISIDEDPIICERIKPRHNDNTNHNLLESSESSKSFLPWFPSNPGEQLCNLVGTWRILQRIGSHRWTTDDLVTAFVAMSETVNRKLAVLKPSLNYLDLGCGNGSVLQMVCWALKNQFDICAFGMEARSEAVSLARRSLTFNVGINTLHNDNDKNHISVIHCDFRDLINYGADNNNLLLKTSKKNEKIAEVHAKKFDLITGTPPYFQVDFTTSTASTYTSAMSRNDVGSVNPNKDDVSSSPINDNGNRIVSSAVINQGGMPTSIQSAPARCEFRGGVEAYCAAASKVLADDGIFVVCENWLNNKRVYEGAEQSGLHIFKVIPVKGKTTRKENLFGVYLMQRKRKIRDVLISTTEYSSNNSTESEPVLPALSVRDENGKWTKEYAIVLEQMSIPAKHEISETLE